MTIKRSRERQPDRIEFARDRFYKKTVQQSLFGEDELETMAAWESELSQPLLRLSEGRATYGWNTLPKTEMTSLMQNFAES